MRAGKKDVLMVHVVACDQVRMGELTDEDAKHLGYSSLGKLRVDWDRRRKKRARWHPNRRVWKVRFIYRQPPPDLQQSTLFALIAKEAR